MPTRVPMLSRLSKLSKLFVEEFPVDLATRPNAPSAVDGSMRGVGLTHAGSPARRVDGEAVRNAWLQKAASVRPSGPRWAPARLDPRLGRLPIGTVRLRLDSTDGSWRVSASLSLCL